MGIFVFLTKVINSEIPARSSLPAIPSTSSIIKACVGTVVLLLLDSEASILLCFYEDFHTYKDKRFKHVELYKYHTGDYGYLK
uniref:Uncharacterized protein n=1 Tax=Romanomermis culicivorax TaxID=13658 RepID=A0A915IT80_ROMCU